MLIQFSVKNFMSFCDPVTLSMVAVPEVDGGSKLDENTFATKHHMRLVKSAAIYGANASGKSNLMEAITVVRTLVIKSFTDFVPEEDLSFIIPFKMRTDTTNQPSSFSIIWLDGEMRFRYEFTLDSHQILDEHLYRAIAPKEPHEQVREQELFHRQGLNVRFGVDFPEGQSLPKSGFKRQNALFISYAAQFSGPIAEQIVNWFGVQLASVSGLDDTKLRAYTANVLLENQWTDEILKMSKHADLGIASIRGEKRQFKREDLPEDMPEDTVSLITKRGGIQILTTHELFDKEGVSAGKVDFDLGVEESEGTRKFVSLSAPLLDVLQGGKVLIIDEFDARLHPILTRALVEQFHGPENPRNAQLIFATHDVNLLDRSLLRRDQIWFTEKDAQGATDLYSMVGFKVEPTDSFSRNYIQGKYGAIPYVSPIVEPEAAKESAGETK